MLKARDKTLDETSEIRLRWIVEPSPRLLFLAPLQQDPQEDDDSLLPETVNRQMDWFSDAWSKLAQL